MSQVPDVAPHGSAAQAIRPSQPGSLHNYSDADLVDQLRGHRFARDRADERMTAITAELERRGLSEARGKIGVAKRHTDPLGRLDLKRLRAEQPEICARYALPGSSSWWSVATLKAEERA